jgi:uncharacterized protein YkwD
MSSKGNICQVPKHDRLMYNRRTFHLGLAMRQRDILSIALILILLAVVGCTSNTPDARLPAQLPVSIAQRRTSILTPANQDASNPSQGLATKPPESSEPPPGPTTPAATQTSNLQPNPTSAPSESATEPGIQPSATHQINQSPPTNPPPVTATDQPVTPTPTNTPSASPTGSGPVVCTTTGSSSFETEVIQLINQERSAAGIPLLSSQAQLTNAARTHSDDMACNFFFSHTSASTGTLFDRLASAGYSYSWAGENIAAGYASPAAVVEGWMASEGHRANILNENFTQIGVGYASWDDSEYGIYWTAVFASP